MSILNLLNSLIDHSDITKGDMKRILKVNIDIFESDNELYKKNIDPVIFNFVLKMLCENNHPEEAKNNAKKIFEIFRTLKKGNFTLDPLVSEKLIETQLFGLEESLNILKESLRNVENLKPILKDAKLFTLANELILSNNMTRPKIAFLLALIGDICIKRKDLRTLAKKRILDPNCVSIVQSVIDSIENDDDPDVKKY